VTNNRNDSPVIISVSVVGSVVVVASVAAALLFIRKKKIKDKIPMHKIQVPSRSASSPTISPSQDWTLKATCLPIHVRTNLYLSDILLALLRGQNVYLQNITIERKLGAGRFAEVFLGVWNGTTPVALKMLTHGATKEFENEMRMLMKLNHVGQ
jgi:hypothetical protein